MLEVDLTVPAQAAVIDEIPTGSEAKRVRAEGRFVLSSDSAGTLEVISLGSAR